MKQIYPASITATASQPASASSTTNPGGDPYTLGVEEEYMLLDDETFDLVQHIDTVLDAVAAEFGDRLPPS